jgi:hypothetical protein
VACYFLKDFCATPGNLSTKGKREISHSVLDTLVNSKAFVVEVAKNLLIRFLKTDLGKINNGGTSPNQDLDFDPVLMSCPPCPFKILD